MKIAEMGTKGEEGWTLDGEGYDLGERVEGKDLSDSRKEEIGLEHMNQLQSCI